MEIRAAPTDARHPQPQPTCKSSRGGSVSQAREIRAGLHHSGPVHLGTPISVPTPLPAPGIAAWLAAGPLKLKPEGQHLHRNTGVNRLQPGRPPAYGSCSTGRAGRPKRALSPPFTIDGQPVLRDPGAEC